MLDFPKTLHVCFPGINPLSQRWILKDWSDVTPNVSSEILKMCSRQPEKALNLHLTNADF